MKVYVTYCCKEKQKTDKKISAIELYKSNRIKNIYELSKKDKYEFLILSGKYGFLFPFTKISYYDKLLQKNEVNELSEKLVNFINKNNIDLIVFFYRPFNQDKNVINYYNAVKIATEKSGIKFIGKEYV